MPYQVGPLFISAVVSRFLPLLYHPHIHFYPCLSCLLLACPTSIRASYSMATPTETSENPGMAPPPQQSPAPLPQPPQRPESLSQRASRVRRVPFPILPTRAAQIGQVADPSEMLKAALYPQLRTASSLNPSNPTENGIVVLDNGEIVELKPPQNLSRLQASQEVAQYYQKFGAILWHHIFDFQDRSARS